MAKYAKKEVVFEHGQPVGVDFLWEDGNVSSFRINDASETLNRYATVHGWKQRLGDAYANAKSIAEARGMFEAVYEHVTSGTDDWNIRGGERGSGLLAEALARVTGRTVEECRAKLATMDKEETAGLRKNPRVDAAYKAIQAERAAEKAEDADLDIDF